MNERAERERIEKDFQDAIEMQKENEKALNEKISALEVSHANQVKNLGEKLNNATQAAQAAKDAATAANAALIAMARQGGGGSSCNIL
jgi:hypothetical protein